MKQTFKLLLCASVLFSAASCGKDFVDSDYNGPTTEEPNVEPEEPETPEEPEVEEPTIVYNTYLYTLNSGSYAGNNASLTAYNPETETTTADIFSDMNGQALGDTAQDFVVLGEQIFISVYNSGVIFVTDLEGTIITTITDTTYAYPRYLATDEESVYVSFYDGAVGKIDPETYALTTVAIDAPGAPEELDTVGGLIYVAVSDYGYGNEQSVVSVFDTELAFVENVAVIENPTTLEVDSEGNVYVISMGNYGYGDPAVYATLQKIEAETHEVSTLSISGVEDALPSAIAVGKDDVLYVIEGVSNASTSWQMIGDIYAYDAATGDVTEFITDDTSVPTLYSISTDVASGEVYAGSSDYYSTGDVYLFSAEGALVTTVPVGVNPMKSIVVEIATIEE